MGSTDQSRRLSNTLNKPSNGRQLPSVPRGDGRQSRQDLAPLLAACPSLVSLDLSHFYCWIEDIPPALQAHPAVAASLVRLDLLSASSAEGFRASGLDAIAAACPNLRHLLALCVFNPRHFEFVGDASLLALAAACPRLSVLHLVQDAMPVFKTPFNGYAVRFSPFYEGRLLVATSQNFGILGNGRLHVLDIDPASGAIAELRSFETADGIYDCAWSESHDSLAVAAIADGSVKLWDASLPPTANPVRSLHEHSREVHSADWNPVRRDSFLTASWDDSVKLWTLDRPSSVRSFREHSYCVYAAVWSPRHADVFASASGDRTARVWDVRDPRSTLVLPAHDHEILSCDWNKYDECSLATASVDKSVRVWDVRAPRAPVANLAGHGYAVRKVKFSPHRESILLSCSYDMTVCMWDYRAEDALIARYDHHTEFVVGVDMSVLVEGLLASTGWDELVYVWQHGTDPRAMP